jgi:hypothetical protein
VYVWKSGQGVDVEIATMAVEYNSASSKCTTLFQMAASKFSDRFIQLGAVILDSDRARSHIKQEKSMSKENNLSHPIYARYGRTISP